LIGFLRRFAAAGFNGDHSSARGVAAYADHSPQDLLARARDHLQPTGLTALFGGRIALTDGLIHHQDIRRALGILREVPAERVLAALRFAPGAPPIGAAKRLRGLSFAATDLAWTTGKGPVVEGPGEAVDGYGRTPGHAPGTVRARPCHPRSTDRGPARVSRGAPLVFIAVKR
jgi:uncharacterized protein (TIGR03083 family)